MTEPTTTVSKSQPDIEENSEEIEISEEETLKQLAKDLEEFAEWAGFDNYHKQAAHLLLLGFIVDDRQRVCELANCTEEFATQIIKRINDNKLYDAYDNWLDEDTGHMALLLDVMVATGILEQKIEEGEPLYYNGADLVVGVHVKHKSNRGSGWWVVAHKIDENGQQFVRLTNSVTGSGGKWRNADDYVRSSKIRLFGHTQICPANPSQV